MKEFHVSNDQRSARGPPFVESFQTEKQRIESRTHLNAWGWQKWTKRVLLLIETNPWKGDFSPAPQGRTEPASFWKQLSPTRNPERSVGGNEVMGLNAVPCTAFCRRKKRASRELGLFQVSFEKILFEASLQHLNLRLDQIVCVSV